VIEGEHYLIGDDSYKKNSDFHLYIKDTFTMILYLCFERGSSDRSIYAKVTEDFGYRIDINAQKSYPVSIKLSGKLKPNRLEKLILLNWEVGGSSSNLCLDQNISQKIFLGDFITEILFPTLEHLEIHHLEM